MFQAGGDKCYSLVWEQVKQNICFQNTVLDLTECEGIFFQRQFRNESNVKVQIFQITFSTRPSLWFQHYLIREETRGFVKSWDAYRAVFGLSPLSGGTETRIPVTLPDLRVPKHHPEPLRAPRHMGPTSSSGSQADSRTQGLAFPKTRGEEGS